MDKPNGPKGYEQIGTIPRFDRKMATDLVGYLLDDGSCIEARVILKNQGRPGKGVLVGFFDSLEAVVNCTEKFNGRAQIYVGLNPRKIELLHAQPPNVLVPHSEGGSGSDILEVRNLLIDVDSKKPSAKVAASQEEIEGSRLVLEKIRRFLDSKGIRHYWGFSGNGWHIVVPVGPYRDMHVTGQRFKKILTYLDQNFSDETGYVDLSTFDPPRLLRMYGSVTVKGANTIERPWRRSFLNGLDEKIQPVDIFSVLSAEVEWVDSRKKFQRFGGVTSTDLLSLFRGKSNVSS